MCARYASRCGSCTVARKPSVAATGSAVLESFEFDTSPEQQHRGGLVPTGVRISMSLRFSQLHCGSSRLIGAGLLSAVLFAPALRAQTSPDQSLYRTRPQLDLEASSLERAGKKDEAASIRDRLKVGDFYPGDRMVVDLFGGEEPFRDTVSVRAGQEVVIQAFPAFSLRGVLRSEADSALTAQAKRYIQRPVVRTQPLVRLLVTGAVGRPGFVIMRGDAAVSDVVTAAGGLTNMARIPKSKFRRGSETLVSPDSLSTVFRSGMTLDQADIRAGDELVIDEKKPSNFQGLIWAISGVLGVVISIISLSRS